MKIHGYNEPGHRMVRLTLTPKDAADVWFHLACSLHAEETTAASRIHIAGLLPQLKRAIVATGYMRAEVFDEFHRLMTQKPAPAPIDIAVRGRIQEP